MERWIFIILATSALIYSLVNKGKNQKIISMLMAVALLLKYIWANNYTEAAFVMIMMGASILSLIYIFGEGGLQIINRIFIGISSGVFLYLLLAKTFYLDGINELRIVLLTPIILFVIAFLVGKKKPSKEFGMMSIWLGLSVFEFLKVF